MRDVTLYTGDALDILPGLQFDAVVTDLPYGIPERWNRSMGGKGKNGRSRLWGNGAEVWDSLVDMRIVDRLLQSPAIIWGGNYYPLPPVRGWLIWEKGQGFSGSDFEMAWTNLNIPGRVHRLSRIDAYQNLATEPKQHPTEKPLSLMLWCLSFLPEGILIVDPCMGVGTTGVACVKTGRSFIGIDKSAEYVELARERITRAQLQPPLITPPSNNRIKLTRTEAFRFEDDSSDEPDAAPEDDSRAAYPNR